MEIIHFEDGTIIGQGKHAPKDAEYFSFFIEKSQKCSSKKNYGDYVNIYDRTTDQIDYDIFEEIEKISMSYDEEDRLDFVVWYPVIYLGMVAEERRERAVLKKRIKRLGMHQILFERMSAVEAATFSTGKKVAELNPLCKERGF